MLRRYPILLLLLGLLLASRPVCAQSMDAMGKQVPWVAAALSEFISDSRAFVARAELQLPSEDGQSSLTVPFVVAMDNGQMRMDLRLADIDGRLVPTEFLSAFKNAGWDRLELLYHPQTATRLVVPAEKAYVEFPKSNAEPTKMENDAMLKLGRMDKVLTGKEMVDGHPCLKYRLTSKDEAAHVDEAYLWQASDLNALPIKLVVKSEGYTYGFQFKQVRMGQPNPKVFGIPASYHKVSSAQALISGVLLKSLGGIDKSPLSVQE